MASYKVPQDVEADDKLIGPFSFRQFIYLIIVAASIAIAWGLSKVFIPLAVIPLPIILLFGALALPLRKDQPMETYLAAIISFYLKPHKRLWEPDGQDTLIEIVAPRTVEVQRTKDLSQTEAEQRLSYLANLVDTQGWAVRGVSGPTPNSAMNSDMYYEAQQAEDVLDTSGRTATMIENQLEQTSERHRQELLLRMQQPVPQTPQPAVQPAYNQPAVATSAPAYTPPAPVNQLFTDPYSAFSPQAMLGNTTVDPVDDSNIQLTLNPYPTMSQSVLQPLSAEDQIAAPPISQPVAPEPPKAPEPPSAEVVSPDIISLANNTDLSVETIAHEAKRIKEKEALSEEVVISLR